MLIKTQNSLYEIDTKNKRIRRLQVEREGFDTVFTDKTGEWQEYIQIGFIEIGCPLNLEIKTDKKISLVQTSNLTEILNIEGSGSYAAANRQVH